MKKNSLSPIKELEGANEKITNELNSTREELKESIKKVEGSSSNLCENTIATLAKYRCY